MLEIFDKNRKRIAIAENASGIEEERKINSIWYLTFSLPYNDAKNEYCQPFNYVRYNGGELYRIMPVDTVVTETGLLTYQCEHVLATLIDNVLFGYHVVGNLGTYTADCIRYVLDKQLTKNWVLYECDFARQFEYGWTQETLLSALFSIATPLADYMWVTDTTVYPWRLSLKSIGVGKRPELYVRSGWNMLSYGATSDPQQICTRLYPLGYGEGVNQLTIKSVNNGCEYLQSPKEYTDKYGIVERIWIDRRYEDPASLLSAAQVMLNELQNPLKQFEISFAELDESDYNTAQIGKRVRILQTELAEQIDTYVTELVYKYDDITSSTLVVANKSTDIASSVADMADRQRIEQAYAQGATQLYSQSLQANCDSNNGAVMDFFLPEDMRIVNKIVAKVRVSSFRAYSKATKAAESKVVSSTTASQKTYSSTSGGGSTSTTSSGGGSTSSATALESSNVLPSQTNGQAVHNHGLSRGARLAVVDTNLNITGYETWIFSGAHTHPAHSHSISAHSHSVSIPSHSHNITIPGHSHNITIPAHEHSITPGIYFYGSPKQFDLYVNGKKKTTITATDTEIDLTEYLIDESSSMIPRGSWLSIEIRPNDLAYVSIDMFVQGFVQSRGDATV